LYQNILTPKFTKCREETVKITMRGRWKKQKKTSVTGTRFENT